MTTQNPSTLMSEQDIQDAAADATALDDLQAADAPQLQREPVHLDSRKGRAARRRQNRQDARPSGRADDDLQDATQDDQDGAEVD